MPRAVTDVGGGAEVDGVEDGAAVVALVAAGVVEAAARAGPADVAVGEEAVEVGRIGDLHRVLIDEVALVQGAPDVVGDLAVVVGHSGGEEVEGDAEALPGVEKGGVVPLDDVARGHALGVGAHGDGGTVGIAAGDHEYVVAAHTVVAGEDVGREIGACQVSEMRRAVRIGPCDADEDAFRHRELLGDHSSREGGFPPGCRSVLLRAPFSALSGVRGRAQVAQADPRQSRHPVVARTVGISMAMTSQRTSEWTLTDSPSSSASRWTQFRKNQMARATLA